MDKSGFRKLNSKGFSPLVVVLLLVVVCAVAGLGYYIYESKSDNEVSTQSEVNTAETKPSENKVYSGPTKNFTDPTSTYKFTYPENWSIEQTEAGIPLDPIPFLHNTVVFTPEDAPKTVKDGGFPNSIDITAYKTGDAMGVLTSSGYSGGEPVKYEVNGYSVINDVYEQTVSTDVTYTITDGNTTILIKFRQKQDESIDDNGGDYGAVTFDASNALPGLEKIVNTVKFL